VRIYADERGASHFEDVSRGLAPIDFAPPAPPLNVAELTPAGRCFLFGGAADWGRGGVPHPTPRRQFCCFLRGELDITVSDGEKRRFSPGSLLLLEDTSGAGHVSQVAGDTEFLIFGVTVTD